MSVSAINPINRLDIELWSSSLLLSSRHKTPLTSPGFSRSINILSVTLIQYLLRYDIFIIMMDRQEVVKKKSKCQCNYFTAITAMTVEYCT